MTPQRIDFLGLPLDTGVDSDGVCGLLSQRDESRLISFINPAAWALAKKDPNYLEMLKQMNLVLPDGEGVALGCRLLNNVACPRISFDMSSLADPFFKTLQRTGASLMIIGGLPTVDEHFHEKLVLTYPTIKIFGTTHGFGEFAPKIAMVMNTQPDAVLVGMGAPRQEAFLLALREAGYKGLAITCGGFFDQYLEDEDYYPAWVDKANLRFAFRLYKEPSRLWKRYLIEYQIYMARLTHALLAKYRGKAEVHARKGIEAVEASVKKKQG
jgi:N-acetylglucosaminyldiphosphoundecaprenol N-acetyl-beta-D-mannosaminyltransferase